MLDSLGVHLEGRKLTLTECQPFTQEIIENHPFVTAIPAISAKGCARCGNNDPTLMGLTSFRAETPGLYCRKCISMGRICSTEKLYTWTGPTQLSPPTNHTFAFESTLSPAQQLASDQIVQNMKANDSLLVWAVCGAGKTELLFEAISQALQAGKRVCLTSPRTDVIIELAPRLQAVFPTTPIAVLYGGSDDRDQFAPLVLATTHQLLRFHHAFDYLIVDEVDAFPYTADHSLQQAVHIARKPVSGIAWLSATPSKKWQTECKQGKRNYTLLPSRYHGHPIPAPSFTWVGAWQKAFRKGRIPKPIRNWIAERIDSKTPMLLFFPSIKILQQALPLFQASFPIAIDGAHSEDPDRKEKIARLRSGDIQLLLTTTILERGITIPALDVAVLGAESPLFTEASLVQIAGRVGRKSDFPTGDCRFFHFGKTRAMVLARTHINEMNKLAKKRGLLT